MTLALIAALLVAGLVLPHLLDLRGAPPGTAVAMWIASLSLRATAGLFVAAYVVVLLPATDVFQAVTHWCWHTVLPLLTTHLGVNGHRIGDLLVLVPAGITLASLVSIGLGVLRATAAVRRMIRRHAVSSGPDGTIMVADQSVVLAAAGLSRPRVVVTTGALTVLDEGELSAGLAHERGHIARRHRWALLYAELCRGLGCMMPGSRRSVRELAFHLERDADAWALRHHDALDLAGAICKAAVGPRNTAALSALSGGSGTRDRVEELVHGRPGVTRLRLLLLRTTAAAAAALALALLVALPGAVAAAANGSAAGALPQHCVS